jgi:ribosome-interacting GTPase 1
MAYLDDIIIYLNSVEEHKEYIKWVLRKLHKENMPVTVKKYKFHIRKTDFVGFIIKPGQISMDLKKIKTIINWQDLESVIRLKLFLRFCNYYYRFIAK